MANPIVTNVADGATHFKTVTPLFVGTGELDGNPYTSGTAITSEGSHTLTVTDGADSTTINFTITTSALVQAIANAHKEVQTAHTFIWSKGIFYLGIAWLTVMFLLLAINPSLALVTSYGILIACYYHLTKPGMVEAISLWSIFVSAKEGTVEIETALPAMAGKIQGILLNAFILAFITPCTIGFLFPDMGLLTALTLVALGAGCGIINVQKLQWEGKGFYQFIFAISIGEIVSIVATVVNFGDTENAIMVTKFVKTYYWLCGSIAFVIAMGYFGLIATKTKAGVTKTFGVIAWMFNHPFKSIGIILTIIILCSFFWPQGLVRVGKFIKDQQIAASVDAKKAGLDIPEVKLPKTKDDSKEKVVEEKSKPSTINSTQTTVGGALQEATIAKVSNRSCDTLITTMTFTPSFETLNNPPTIKVVDAGFYKIKVVSSQWTQYYFANGGNQPRTGAYPQDANGVLLDRPGKQTFISEAGASRMPLPKSPYGGFIITASENRHLFIGEELVFSIPSNQTDLKLDLNVVRDLDPGTGTFEIELYRCQ